MSAERDELLELITPQVIAQLRRGATTAPEHAHGAKDDHDPATCERCRTFGVSAVRGPEETRVLAAAGASRVVATVGYCPASDGLASLIDHTLLKPDATRDQI